MSSNDDVDGPTLRDRYEQFDIDRQYDHPANIDAENSHFGNGDYPPDWPERREAVLEHQNGRCARCRTPLKHEEYYNCHHYRPVKDGGQHSLSNLVDLCVNCHKLIHPAVETLDGDWREAPMFPSPDADRRMATVREPTTTAEKQAYQPELALIAEQSPVGENEFAMSSATVPISPADALRMETDFDQLLADMGLAEKTTLTVRTVNREHSPLRNATVDARISVSDRTMSGQTDEAGETEFEVISGADLELRTSKPAFADEHRTITPTGETAYEEVVLERNDAAGGAGVAGAQSNASGGESRRPVLKTLGTLGVGGVIGYLLDDALGLNESNSEPASNDIPGAGTQTEPETPTRTATATEVPVREFDAVWSDTTETFEAVTHVETADERLFTATDNGLLRQFAADGSVNWSTTVDGSVVDIAVFEDGLAVLTEAALSLRSLTNGSEQWTTEIAASRGTVAATAGTVLVAQSTENYGTTLEDAYIAAFGAESGGEIWRLSEVSTASLTLHGLRAYFYTDTLRFVDDVAVGPEGSASTVAEAESVTSVPASAPAFATDTSLGYYPYSADRSDTLSLAAFDTERNRQVWSEHVTEYGSTPVAVAAATDVAVATTDRIRLFDADGGEQWSQESPGIAGFVAGWDEETLYAHGAENEVFGLRTADGAKTHSRSVDAAVETLTGFRDGVVFTTEDGATRFVRPE